MSFFVSIFFSITYNQSIVGVLQGVLLFPTVNFSHEYMMLMFYLLDSNEYNQVPRKRRINIIWY
jgi:hypothetical protein